MKKTLITTILLCCIGFSTIMTSPCFALQSKRTAVLPVDIVTPASSFSIYPNSLNLITADITNCLISSYNFDITDADKTNEILKRTGTNKIYNEFLMEYKDKYSFNYEKLHKISKILNVNYFIFVSGGFDTTQFFLKRSIADKLLIIPWATPVTPSYRLNTTITLVDAKKSMVIFQKSYKQDFNSQDFGMPSQHFGENIVPINQIEKFSKKITPIICKETSLEVVLSNDDDIPAETPEVKSKEGIMTKDGLLSFDQVAENRKKTYKNWAIKRF